MWRVNLRRLAKLIDFTRAPDQQAAEKRAAEAHGIGDSLRLRTLNAFSFAHKNAVNMRLADEDFTCPKCGAAYKIVRVPAPAESRGRPLHCKSCSQEFASTDEGNILKYFLVGRGLRSPATGMH